MLGLKKLKMLLPALCLIGLVCALDDDYEEYYRAVERVYENRHLATDHHRKAIDRVNQGDYGGSLPYFQLAVRLSPSNVVYWNDLGVTEMRVGHLEKAERRFIRAIEIDPKFAISHENLKEIRQYYSEGLGEESSPGGSDSARLKTSKTPRAFEHSVREPPEIDAEEFMRLTVAEDVRDAALLGAGPIVVRKAAQHWGWNLSAFSFRNLDAHFKDQRVDYYPHNMQHESVHPFFTNLGEALRTLQSPESVYLDVDVSEPGTYVQWNVREEVWRRMLTLANATLPELFDDSHWTRECLSNDEQEQFNFNVHWKMMLVGEKGAGMFNHKDVLRMASWQVQVAGRKKWHMCSHSQDPFMSVHMDTLYPDYAAWPQLRNASCFMTTLSQGDALYYPRDWWHQTENLETPSVALSGSTVNHANWAEFGAALRKQCEPGGGNVFLATAETCAAVERCNDVWRIMYENGGRDDEL